MPTTDRWARAGVIAQLFLIIGLGFAVYQFAKEFDWRRKAYAIDLMRAFNADALPVFRPIRDRWPNLTNPELLQPMPMARAAPLWRATDPDSVTLRNDIVACLNYMEAICKGCEVGVIDEKLTKQVFGALFQSAHSLFHSFMKVSWEDMNGLKPTTESDHWKSIDRVVTQRWYPPGGVEKPPR
jgi:hypothetical protein